MNENEQYNGQRNMLPGSEMDPSDPRTQVMSLKDWLITWLIFLIPCVNIVMILVWAFSSNGNFNRRNYCRAYLIIIGVLIVLYFIAMMVFGAAILAVFGDLF